MSTTIYTVQKIKKSAHLWQCTSCFKTFDSRGKRDAHRKSKCSSQAYTLQLQEQTIHAYATEHGLLPCWCSQGLCLQIFTSCQDLQNHLDNSNSLWKVDV